MKIIETTHELIKLLLAPILALLLVFMLFIKGNTPNNIHVDLKNQGIQIYISGAVNVLNNRDYKIIESDDQIVVVLYKTSRSLPDEDMELELSMK